MSFNWTAINAKLPTGKSTVEHTRRNDLFQKFNPDTKGFLSLVKVVKGISDLLQLDDSMKPAIQRAFRIAKSSTHSKHEYGDDFLEIREFRFFLLTLRQYLEYCVAFGRVDTDHDKRISLQELKAAQSKIEMWVGKIDPSSVFKQMDTEPDSEGSISFEEFCCWAIKKNLDLEDDDDNIHQ